MHFSAQFNKFSALFPSSVQARSFQFSSAPFKSVQCIFQLSSINSVHCFPVQFKTVHFSLVQLHSNQFSALFQLSSNQFSALFLSSVQVSLVQLRSNQFTALIQLSSVQINSVHGFPAQFKSVHFNLDLVSSV